MRLLPLLVLVFLSLLATAAPLSAQDAPEQDAPEQGAEQNVQSDAAPSARLDFGSEGAGCPDAGAFADEVSARIGRVGFDASSERVALVRIARTGSEALVTAEFGGNTRVFRDADCRVAAEAAAAAIAVWLDEPTRTIGVLGALRGGGGSSDSVFGVGGLGLRATEPSDGRVLLRVTTNLTTREPDEDFSFHIETNTGRGTGGSAHYFERLCLMPCETRVAPGVHQFGVGRGTFPAFALEDLTQLEVDSELHIEVRKMSPLNQVGRWFIFAAILTGLPLSIAAIVKRDDWGDGAMWGIVGATGGLILGGSLMIALSDSGGVDVTVRPL